MLAAGLRNVLGLELPDPVLPDLAAAAARRDGLRLAPLLLAYIAERRIHAERWISALERSYHAGLPHLFVWGVRDPVSGGHVLERLRARLPQASYLALDDAGHYPQLEEPQAVVGALVAFLTPDTARGNRPSPPTR